MDILTVKMDGRDFGILLDEVVYIVGKADNIKMIPNTYANLRGITNVSGDDVPVYSLTSRLGHKDAEVVDLVVVRSNGMKLGLEVGTADAIVHVEDSKLFPVPAVLNGEPSGFKSFASLKDQKLLPIIDVDHLLSQEERKYIHSMLEENAKESDTTEESQNDS